MIWVLIAGFTVVFLAHVAPFPFLLDSFAPSRSIWRVPRAGGPPTIYLTYDDGPNPAVTPALLDALRDSGAHATFFLIDAHVTEATASIVRRMFEEGHGVGLHSDTRALMIKTPSALAALLTHQADRIEQLAGSRPCRLFRPHAGWRSGSMYDALARINYRLVGWGWRLWDVKLYGRRDADDIARGFARRASAGDIIVMHDAHHVNPAADRRYTIEATRQLIAILQARGFSFASLCRQAVS